MLGHELTFILIGVKHQCCLSNYCMFLESADLISGARVNSRLTPKNDKLNSRAFH